MLNSAKVIGFIPSKNFKMAKSFYGKKLGLSLLSEDDYALVYSSGDTMLRIVKVESFDPAKYTILGWEIIKINNMVDDLRKKGVKFLRYPGMGQNQSGIWKAPSGARVAWFKDGDGNILSLTEYP